MPAAINEVLWSIGITSYNAVYARIGTDAIAAVNINSLRETVISLYQISPSAAESLRGLMLVYALSIWLKVFNFMLFIGALRAGGDTRFAMFTELFSIWVIGVPSALIGGFVLHLPVYWVYAMVLLEEAAKAIIVLRCFLTRKWIHDLVSVTGDQTPGALSMPEPAS